VPITPALKRFDVTVLKNKSGSDAAQVPALAAIDFYRQGATLASSFSFGTPPDPPETASLTLQDTGRLVPGDQLKVFSGGALGSTVLTVRSITDSTRIVVDYDVAVSGQVNDRLVVTNSRPTYYNDRLGNSAGSSALTTDSSTGRAAVYMRADRFDYLVSGTGFTTRLHQDADGGFLKSPINAADFSTLQAALDAVQDGGSLYIPAGTWNLQAHGAGGRLLLDPSKTRGVRIHGDGPATVLVPKDKDTPAILLDLRGLMGNIEISQLDFRDFQIRGSAVERDALGGEANGISLRSDSVYRKFVRPTFASVHVQSVGANGMRVEHGVLGSVRDCQFQDCRMNGVSLSLCTYINLIDCYAILNDDCGVFAEDQSGLLILGCAFDYNQVAQVGKLNLRDAQVRLRHVFGPTILGCNFEGYVQSISKTALVIEQSLCAFVQGNFFNDTTFAPDSIGIYMVGDEALPSSGSHVGTNNYGNVALGLKIASVALDTVVLPQIYSNGTLVPLDLPGGAAADGIRLTHIREGVRVPQYTNAGLPSAEDGSIIYVRDGATGARFLGRTGGAWVPLG
jgi:hypothetical protein